LPLPLVPVCTNIAKMNSALLFVVVVLLIGSAYCYPKRIDPEDALEVQFRMSEYTYALDRVLNGNWSESAFDSLMNTFSNDYFDAWILGPPTVQVVTTKAALRIVYEGIARNTYANFSRHGVSNFDIKKVRDHPKTFSMDCYLDHIANVFAAPGVIAEIGLVGSYSLLWVEDTDGVLRASRFYDTTQKLFEWTTGWYPVAYISNPPNLCSGYQSLESRPWSSIVLTIGASVALGVCAGVAYSTYESSLYAPVATTTTSVVTVAPVARAAAGDSFVEASIPAASEEVVETQSFAAPSTSWAAGLSASVSLLVGAAVYKLKSQKPVPSISPLDVYTKGVIPAATLVAAQPAFAMETNKLAPIATALFIALPTFFLIILYVSTRANLDNQSGAFDQDYFDKSKSAGNKKTNLAAKLKGEGLAFYAEKRGGK